MVALLPTRALPNVKIYVSLVGYGAAFVQLAAASGGLAATVDANGNLSANFNGFPIVITQSLPAITTTLTTKLMMVAGDLRQAVALGERRGLTIQRLDERFADTDQIGVKATERVDIVCGDLGDNQNPGAVVGLVAP
jgi:HK97 family phage major capsid protein